MQVVDRVDGAAGLRDVLDADRARPREQADRPADVDAADRPGDVGGVHCVVSARSRISASIRGDDVVDLEVGRVDEHGVLGRLHPLAVELVARTEVGRERVRADVGALGLAAPRADVGIGLQVDLHLGVGRDDGADVAPLDHDVPLMAELALPLAHHLAHLVVARDDGDHAVDARLPDRRGHVGARDRHAARLVEDHRVPARELPERLRLGERQPFAHREPGEGAVHRARVEVAEAEPLREIAGDGALAGSGRSIDGDDHLRVTCSRRSWKPGKDTPTLSKPSISTPSRLATPATAPSIAIRWSPRASIRPPFGRVGTPVTSKPSVVRLGAEAERPQRVDQRLDPVGLLEPQLLGAAHAARAARVRREQREQRELVDQERHLAGVDLGRGELGGADLEVAAGLLAEAAAREDPDARAHPVEHVEEPRSPRVEPDVVDRDPRLGHDRRGDDERRGRREVAGHVDGVEAKARRRVDADRVRAAS